MKKILILGGYGFMGKNINLQFSDSSYEVYNESRRTGCDITNISNLCNKLEILNPDIIINAAAHVGSISYVSQNSAQVVHDNTLMYINLYKAVSLVKKEIIIINPISNCSYPGIIDIQTEEEWWNGPVHESVESYGNPKKMGFIISECYRKQYGIKTVNLIVPNAYGPNDYLDEQRTHALNGIIMRMLKSKINGDEQFVIWGTGKPIREWIYMPDMAVIIKKIVDNKTFDLPNPLNIAQEQGISIIDLVTKVREIIGVDMKIINDTSKQDGAPIKVLGKNKFDKYFKDFVFTDYDKGIRETIKYYESFI